MATGARSRNAARAEVPVNWNWIAVAPTSRFRPGIRSEAWAEERALEGLAGGITPGPLPNALTVRAALTPPQQIVQRFVLWSVVGGFLPFAVLDVAFLSAVNYYMIKAIARYYGVSIEKTRFQDLLSSIFAALIPQSFAAALPGALVRMIPFVGSFLSGFTQSAFAAGITYMLGNIAIETFVAYGGNTDPEVLLESINDAVGRYVKWYESSAAERAA